MRKLKDELKKLRMRIPGLSHIGYMKDGKLIFLGKEPEDAGVLNELEILFEKSESLIKGFGGGRLKEVYLHGTFCEIVAVKVNEEMGFALVQSSLPLALIVTEVKRFFGNNPLSDKKLKGKKPNIRKEEISNFLNELTGSEDREDRDDL